MPKYKPLTRFDRLPFGKRQGELVQDVMTDDPRYFKWLSENTALKFDLKAEKPNVARLDTILKTGEYAGLTVAEVIRNNPKYAMLNLKGRMDFQCEYYCKRPENVLKALWAIMAPSFADTRKLHPKQREKMAIAEARYQEEGRKMMESRRPENPPF